MEFEVGSVVCLKSSGPKMTIQSLKDGRAVCVWQTENATMKEIFDVRMLEMHKPLDLRTARS